MSKKYNENDVSIVQTLVSVLIFDTNTKKLVAQFGENEDVADMEAKYQGIGFWTDTLEYYKQDCAVDVEPQDTEALAWLDENVGV